MIRVFSFFLICFIGVLGVVPVQADEEKKKPVIVSREDALVAETRNFQVYCYANKFCAAIDVTEDQRRSVRKGLDELEEAREWLKKMGFKVENANLEAGTDGKLAMRLQRDAAIHQKRCVDMVYACRRLSRVNDDGALRASRVGIITLPIEHVDRLAGGEDLVHEYVHALQPTRDEGRAKWLNEMVATAIGSAWVRKRTGETAVYQPKYSMVLDRVFWDGGDDPGFGKWDYAIALGEKIGSQDGVEYLAQDAFINASNHARSRNENSMTLFYDAELLATDATFDKFFPEYVARFNNVETGGEQEGGRTGTHLYYGDIAGKVEETYLVDIPDIDAPFQAEFPGEVAPFAAHPMLLTLKVPSAVSPDEADNLFLAKIEVTKASDAENLTLVREHRLAVEKHRDAILIDGNAPPEELGFFRVAHTPAPDSTDTADFSLEVRTRPVTFDTPSCFEVGQPTTIKSIGLGNFTADNWRLKVDNGKAQGLVVTPASVGEITIEVEIDSPITRGDTGITPKAPTQTLVGLGTFDVARDSCIPPLVGNMVASFNGDLRDFWHSFGLNSHGSTHWKAVLNIETGPPEPHPFEEDVLIYPDDGSTFQLSGRSEFVSCNRTEPGICNHSTDETYTGSGPIVVGRGDLEIISEGGNIWLQASLPVNTIMNNHGGFEYTETIPTRWNIGCVSTDPWWHFAGDQHARFIQGGGTAKLAGTWVNGSHEEIEFDCSENWGGNVTETGEYSASMHIRGLVKVKPR